MMPFCPLLGRHWRVGDRVVVTAEHASDERHGEILEGGPRGALVRHDDASFVWLLGRGKATWGWGWSELEPEAQ